MVWIIATDLCFKLTNITSKVEIIIANFLLIPPWILIDSIPYAYLVLYYLIKLIICYFFVSFFSEVKQTKRVGEVTERSAEISVRSETRITIYNIGTK